MAAFYGRKVRRSKREELQRGNRKLLEVPVSFNISVVAMASVRYCSSANTFFTFRSVTISSGLVAFAFVLSIIMGAHFLHSGKVDDKPQIKEKYYTIIEDEAEHLLALVNKLLTISKLENKKLILNKWDIDIDPIIADLIDKTKAKASKPLEIVTDLKIKNVFADEQYLTEAIANLLDNAIKYSKDEIKIKISTIDTDKNVLLKVRDNGIGITKEEQQIIFDKFGRAAIHEKNRKGGVSGFGLGLNYVDQVMQAHGGKVTVSSEKDKFSEFTLYIPKNV